MHKHMFGWVLLSLVVMSVACADGVAAAGEGEGDVDDAGEGEDELGVNEGEGEGEGEGDVDAGEGEGDIDVGEGEGDDGDGEGEGEDELPLDVTDALGDRNAPTPIALTYDEVVANNQNGAECGAFSTTEASLLIVSATNPGCLSMSGLEADTEVFLYDGSGMLIESDDDDGEGSCSVIKRVIPAGDYIVCVSHYNDLTLIPTRFIVAAGPELGLGEACDPELSACVAGECLSVSDPTDFQCAIYTPIPGGEACIPGATAATCVGSAVCSEDTFACTPPSLATCEASTQQADPGENSVALPAAVDGASCGGASYVVLRYMPRSNGKLTVEVGGGGTVVGAAATCTATAQCIEFIDDVNVRAGVDIFLSVEGNANTTANFRLTEVPSLVEGDACPIVRTFAPDVEQCDFTDGQYCSGTAGCAFATPLVFDTPLEFTSVSGTRFETCYSFSGPGSYTFATEGACSVSGNDTLVRVIGGGVQIASNDDVAPLEFNRCSRLERTLPAGDYFACVSHFNFDGDTADVTFTATHD
jgi:hypothetical protein